MSSPKNNHLKLVLLVKKDALILDILPYRNKKSESSVQTVCLYNMDINAEKLQRERDMPTLMGQEHDRKVVRGNKVLVFVTNRIHTHSYRDNTAGWKTALLLRMYPRRKIGTNQRSHPVLSIQLISIMLSSIADHDEEV